MNVHVDEARENGLVAKVHQFRTTFRCDMAISDADDLVPSNNDRACTPRRPARLVEQHPGMNVARGGGFGLRNRRGILRQPGPCDAQ